MNVKTDMPTMHFTFYRVGDMVERIESEIISLMKVKEYGIDRMIKEKKIAHKAMQKIWRSMENSDERKQSKRAKS